MSSTIVEGMQEKTREGEREREREIERERERERWKEGGASVGIRHSGLVAVLPVPGYSSSLSSPKSTDQGPRHHAICRILNRRL